MISLSVFIFFLFKHENFLLFIWLLFIKILFIWWTDFSLTLIFTLMFFWVLVIFKCIWWKLMGSIIRSLQINLLFIMIFHILWALYPFFTAKNVLLRWSFNSIWTFTFLILTGILTFILIIILLLVLTIFGVTWSIRLLFLWWRNINELLTWINMGLTLLQILLFLLNEIHQLLIIDLTIILNDLLLNSLIWIIFIFNLVWVMSINIVKNWACLAWIWMKRFNIIGFFLSKTVFELFIMSITIWCHLLLSMISLCHPTHILLLSYQLLSCLQIIDTFLQSALSKLETHGHFRVIWIIRQVSFSRMWTWRDFTCSDRSHKVVCSPCCIIPSNTVSCHSKMTSCHCVHRLLAVVIVTYFTRMRHSSTSNCNYRILIHFIMLLLRLKGPILLHFLIF